MERYIEFQVRTNGIPSDPDTVGTVPLTQYNDTGSYVVDGALTAGVGSNNMIQSEFTMVVGTLNRVDEGCSGIMINGNQNIVESGSSNISILNGNQNIILGGVSNVTLVGVSNVTVSSSNTTIISDGGVNTSTGFDIIDGSFDVVENPNRELTFTEIDGNLDEVFEAFPEEVYTVVDGGSNITF